MEKSLIKIYPRVLNNGFSEKFTESYRDQQTPEEGRSAQRPKCFDNNNDDDISTNVYNVNIVNS